RSILASPVSKTMKDRLNTLKLREPYRPVAPVCLEDHAADIFDPGTRDHHMLFEHKVRDSWKEKIPAALHVDQTARLQTVTRKTNPVLFDLLTEFYKVSGIPVLCNTSAN